MTGGAPRLQGGDGGLRETLSAAYLRGGGGGDRSVAHNPPSIEQIGVWPWPRRLHADLLRRLDSAGVRDVVFDVDFSSPSDPASDRAFVEALESAGGSGG